MASGDVTNPKRKRKYLAVVEKIRVLDMINIGKSHIDIMRHFGLDRSTIGKIKKAGSRIRKTVDITLNMSTKKFISPYYEPLIHKEAALVTWIAICRKNIAMDRKTIQTKAMKLYETYSSNESEENQGGDENHINDRHCDSLIALRHKNRFPASSGWLKLFSKRFELKGLFIPRNCVFAPKIDAEIYVKTMGNSGNECKPEQLPNLD